jgi:predicted Zn finger-like uncharacterized protein
MPPSRCPRCDTRVRVEDADLGYDVECPSCGAVFAARPEGEPPRRAEPDDGPRRRYEDEDDSEERPRRRRRRRDLEEVVEDARRAVFLPALFTILAAAVSILYHAADTAFILMNPQALNNLPFVPRGNPPPIGVIVAAKVCIFLWEAAAVAGAGAMMRLRSHPFAVVAMVMQVIPCTGVCCVATLPFGVWGLVVLNRPDVKDGFEAAARLRERAARTPRERDHRGYEDEDDDR